MFTLDASVHINALNHTEPGSAASQMCLQRLVEQQGTVICPTLLLVELAAAVARVLDDTALALELAQAVRALPGQIWVALDDDLAAEAARLGAEARLRGADAVYAAVARRFGTTLITRDRQQLERLRDLLPVLTPEAWLGH
ncbi:MAG TPA: PIN domain-containing protein [Anaerolineae bacterium]|nr:PIN domain-containing protein [Anaerolineae bacterium]HQK15342.1 PIN domain-containing protein [Anaerolineae bacterium]